MEDPMDLLEKRVRALELQILPKDSTNVPQDKGKPISVVDLFLNTNTMIQSALSCREVITDIINKATLINDYLNPIDYFESQGQTGIDEEAKRKYVLELFSEVKQLTALIKEYRVLNESNDLDMSSLVDRVEDVRRIFAHNVALYEECKEVTNNILESVQKYNEICQNLRVLFASIDKELTDMEKALNVVPMTDVDL